MPTVILFRGKAATGKTTLSTAYARTSGSLLLRKDDIYDATAPIVLAHTKRNAICEPALRNLIKSNIVVNASIVVEHSVNHRPHAENFRDWVRGQRADVITFLVTCSDERVWKARLDTRVANPSPNQLITDLDSLKRHYEAMDTRPLEGETVLDTIRPMDELLEIILRAVEGPSKREQPAEAMKN